jgi:3-hydroxyisobutyrate dehydrogenase-like beta-hydroxyacid dehydrogenase
VRLLSKDMDLVQQLADEMEMPVPVLDAAAQFWVRASEAGMAEQDPASAVELYEDQAGVQLRER